MNVKKCENGHFFDADKYSACPHCGSVMEKSGSTSKTEAGKNASHKNAEAEVKIMPEKTMGKTFGVFDESKKERESGNDSKGPIVNYGPLSRFRTN